jgi:hypothetical protein
MLDYLVEHAEIATERKLRLLAAGWCRDIVYLLPRNKRRWAAIRIIERYADGLASVWELAEARIAGSDAERQRHHPQAGRAVYWAASRRPDITCLTSVWEGAGEAIALDAMKQAQVPPREMAGVYDQALAEITRRQADLVRECLGNPFRPASVDTAWLTWASGIVVHLAEAIYDEQAFDRMPILADALEEAGCSDADILGHLRDARPHVRGCFVLDVLTGRS